MTNDILLTKRLEFEEVEEPICQTPVRKKETEEKVDGLVGQYFTHVEAHWNNERYKPNQKCETGSRTRLQGEQIKRCH